MTHRLLIPVTPGELLDRISILRIKLRRIEDREKLKAVGAELHGLTEVWDRSPFAIRMPGEVIRCLRELGQANEDIWDAENEVRLGEASAHNLAFAATKAREANDRRTELKRLINTEMDVETVEVKEYGGNHAT